MQVIFIWVDIIPFLNWDITLNITTLLSNCKKDIAIKYFCTILNFTLSAKQEMDLYNCQTLSIPSCSYCLSLTLPLSACIPIHFSQYLATNILTHKLRAAQLNTVEKLSKIVSTLVLCLGVDIVLIQLVRWSFPHYLLLKLNESSDCTVFSMFR